MDYDFYKRIVDIFVSLILIILLFPLLILIYLIVFFHSGRPVLYSHLRAGKDGKEFRIYKFRTMKRKARQLQGKGIPTEKLITIEGRILRRLHFDELLQLFNVFKGDMSIIGPRPLDTKDYYIHLNEDPKYRIIYYHQRPGLTGLNSVLTYLDIKTRLKIMKKLHLNLHTKKSLNPKGSKKYHQKKKEREFYYAFNKSFKLDISILYWTFLMELKTFIKMIKDRF